MYDKKEIRFQIRVIREYITYQSLILEKTNQTLYHIMNEFQSPLKIQTYWTLKY